MPSFSPVLLGANLSSEADNNLPSELFIRAYYLGLLKVKIFIFIFESIVADGRIKSHNKGSIFTILLWILNHEDEAACKLH